MLLSGNGCLRRGDGASLNIGDSTGGYTRLSLQDWELKDGRAYLDADPPEDLAADLHDAPED